MKLIFSDNAWDDYLYWQKTNKKILRRINTLIKETK
ncbi:MAG: type II toxin-antitoxin system YoeB family toxin, partial [Desulfobacteraceae bacterium]|nr:type II toxin-antitoxin system YoeB family toxin [Desulfobacteraceae bacterium]